jgi:hypothetical protein
MKYNKQSLFYEAIAKLTLLHLFPAKFSALAHEDRPDLQDKTADIGIEVTRALFKSAIKPFGFTPGTDGEETDGNPLSRLSKIECETGLYDRSQTAYSLNEIWQGLSELNMSFSRKIDKLNTKDFALFSENGLYIFSPSVRIFSDREVRSFSDRAAKQQEKYKNKFDIVYINDFGNFFYCNLRLQQITVYTINPEKLLDFCMEAKAFADDMLRNA